MKFGLAVLSLFGAASAKYVTKEIGVDPIKSDSKVGKALLSKARRLNDEDEEIDLSWMTQYDLKFQGCYETNAWNAEADGDEDVKVSTKRLVRFRLCPTGSCSDDSANGCQNGYGDYLVDLNIFVETWNEARMTKQEYDCEMLRENCGCDGDDVDDEDACENKCYYNAGMDYCIDDEDGDQFRVEEYVECAEFQWDEDDDANGRRLEDAEEEEPQYFIGPYCSSQGGAINFGVFTDETCTEAYDSSYGRNFYKAKTGYALQYSKKSIVEYDCKTCIQAQYNNRERKLENEYADQNGQYAAEICVQPYFSAAKCEENLSAVQYPNTYACNFMEGVKTTYRAGKSVTVETESSKAASAFIGVFAVSFVALGAYVFILKTKLDKAQVSLAE